MKKIFGPELPFGDEKPLIGIPQADMQKPETKPITPDSASGKALTKEEIEKLYEDDEDEKKEYWKR